MALKSAVKTEDKKKLVSSILKAGARPEILKTEVKISKIGHMQDSAGYEEKIRRKAYEIFLRDGRQHGNDLAHWFEAEEQLKAGMRY